MKKLVLSLLGTLALAASTVTLANQSVTQTQPAQMVQTKKAQGIWIDVHTAEEFAAGHIEGAINIPFDQIEQRISEVTSDKNAPINLYCRSGRRSGIALDTLKGLGFTNLTNQGGYQDLVAKGIK